MLCALLLRNLDKMDEDVCFIVFESLLAIPKCFCLSVPESLVPQAVLAHKGSNILFPKLRLHIGDPFFNVRKLFVMSLVPVSAASLA